MLTYQVIAAADRISRPVGRSRREAAEQLRLGRESRARLLEGFKLVDATDRRYPALHFGS